MLKFGDLTGLEIQHILDFSETVRDAVISIAEREEPDWIGVCDDVWFDETSNVFKVSHVYEPPCDCCSFEMGVSVVNYEAVAKFIEEDVVSWEQ